MTGMRFMKNECDRFLVDANVLIYLADRKDGPKHEKAMGLFSDSGKEQLFVSAQCIREFANVCLSKRFISKEAIVGFVDSFTERFVVLQDDPLDTRNAVEMCGGNPNLFWDAAIVSMMKRNGIEKIFTENVSDFTSLGVKAINPLK